jgi:hypothetical protein
VVENLNFLRRSIVREIFLCRSGFSIRTSKRMIPQHRAGSSVRRACTGVGGNAWPAKLKFIEQKYVSPPCSSSTPGGHGRRKAWATRLHASSLITMLGSAAFAFFWRSQPHPRGRKQRRRPRPHSRLRFPRVCIDWRTSSTSGQHRAFGWLSFRRLILPENGVSRRERLEKR